MSIQPISALDAAKLLADGLAEQHAAECRRWLLRDPIGGIVKAAAVKPNHKFFRRLAGLRNGDLQVQS